MGKWLGQNITEEDLQMANKCMTKCKTSLVIREMRIETTMPYHDTLNRMAEIKKTDNIEYW